ncbi:unnamed protein product [Phyllotreta striolata]|uniref:Uncharacterized protein n=1 Tax=Phyllotreta striolata TaxID=444603 RepID=A0A9N9XP81_PHYSR|nr:unnamed protein product [Phyllotreta striolata]
MDRMKTLTDALSITGFDELQVIEEEKEAANRKKRQRRASREQHECTSPVAASQRRKSTTSQEIDEEEDYDVILLNEIRKNLAGRTSDTVDDCFSRAGKSEEERKAKSRGARTSVDKTKSKTRICAAGSNKPPERRKASDGERSGSVKAGTKRRTSVQADSVCGKREGRKKSAKDFDDASSISEEEYTEEDEEDDDVDKVRRVRGSKSSAGGRPGGQGGSRKKNSQSYNITIQPEKTEKPKERDVSRKPVCNINAYRGSEDEIE